MTRSILIVDDDPEIRSSLGRALARGEVEVRDAPDAESALSAVADRVPDVVLSDVRMPGMSGMELLELIRERAPTADVVLMTAYDDLPTVARAMREGAVDFLVKPLDLHRLRLVVDRVFEDRRARQAASRARGADGEEEAPSRGAPELIGRHPTMVEIFKRIGQLAATRATVVIRGESGTGKELIAQAVHALSEASAEPFVAVNCTALPLTLLESELFGHVRGAFTGATSDRRGRFAMAGRGTIFLDEIGDTAPDLQAKLLRVLQEREFYPVGAERPERTEARVIAATHRDLEAMVEEGRFRTDLYYRLRVVEIKIPPLRERPQDLPALADHLIARGARAANRAPPVLSAGALEALLAHDWPGNVRELENCLTRALVLATGDVIRQEHITVGRASGAATAPHRLATLEEVEAEHVARVLSATGGNKTRAAEILGISRARLRRILERPAAGRDESP